LRGIGPSAILASYGGLLGVLLGAASSALWMRSLRIHQVRSPLYLGEVGVADFAVFLVLVIMFSIVSIGLLFLMLRGSGTLAQRIGRLYATGTLAVFLLYVATIMVMAVSLRVGWFGNVDMRGLR
jgi:hypothetical protein